MAARVLWLEPALNAWLAGKTIKALLLNQDWPTLSNVAGGLDELPDWRGGYRVSIPVDYELTDAIGYTAGGIVVTNVHVVLTSDGTYTDRVSITCDPVDFGTLELYDQPVAGIAFYVDTGDPETDYIIAVDRFDPDRYVYPEIENFTYLPDDNGITFLQTGVEDGGG